MPNYQLFQMSAPQRVEEAPWSVTSRDDMEKLGPIIEGIRLRAAEDC
jgi:hypothetical protein